MTTDTALDWNTRLREQLTFHWKQHLRPRLDGLTDDEYFWEPAPGSWSVRPRGASATPPGAGVGPWVCDFAFPEPVPPPVTTIAWRLAHVIVGVFGMRVHSHFGGPALEYHNHRYAGSADEALAQLDDGYRGRRSTRDRSGGYGPIARDPGSRRQAGAGSVAVLRAR